MLVNLCKGAKFFSFLHPILKIAIIRFAQLLIFFISIPEIVASARMTPEEYIEKYKSIAIQEMKRHGIPASITLAQGGLESGWGSSELAVNANNHFGIKCHGWEGAIYRKDAEIPKECFRKYDSPEQSYRDHSDFLRYRERYSFLFTLACTDYKGWANGLLSAGYATNPNYPSLLINLIEKYGLDKYDKTGATPQKREVHELNTNNGIQFIVACSTDTYEELAKKYHIYKADLKKYNEVSGRNVKPKPGSYVYLGWKKSKAQKNYDIHIAEADETYYDISQIYGIRLNSLLKLNNAVKGDIPTPGDTVYLRRKKRR